MAIRTVPFKTADALLNRVNQLQHAADGVRDILNLAYHPRSSRKELAVAIGEALDALEILAPRITEESGREFIEALEESPSESRPV